ncbi:hypothetical protein OG874_21235 [Nocardia sp. NBC_00565]|nr:hypothetical protein [Nocardia sp. NBC_00565]WUC07455.1 hypothetical protein OG874_21235 [Nocardia sp. NBC_00565]
MNAAAARGERALAGLVGGDDDAVDDPPVLDVLGLGASARAPGPR